MIQIVWTKLFKHWVWKWQQFCPVVLSYYSYITSLTLIEWLVSYTRSALRSVCHYNTNLRLTVYFKVFWKSILTKYFQNDILFCISNTFFSKAYYFVFSKYYSKVFAQHCLNDRTCGSPNLARLSSYQKLSSSIFYSWFWSQLQNVSVTELTDIGPLTPFCRLNHFSYNRHCLQP